MLSNRFLRDKVNSVISRVVYKHQMGKHDQDKHGYRYGGGDDKAANQKDIIKRLQVYDKTISEQARSDPKRAQEVWEKMGYPGDLLGFVSKAYEYKDEESGMESRVVNIRPMTNFVGIDKEKVFVGGYIYKDGNQVGEFQRSFARDHRSELSVKHDYLVIDDGFNNTGFGTAMYKNSEAIYKASGIKSVTVFADMTIGSYAWARMGFRAVMRSDFESAFRSAERAWMNAGAGKQYVKFPANKIKDMFDIAALVSPWDGTSIGKTVLISTKYDPVTGVQGVERYWHGIKYLDDNDDGYVAGQLYYESREKKGK